MLTPKPASDSFEAIAKLASPNLRPTCLALRQQILRIDSTSTMLVWPKLKIASFGIGPKKNTHHYAYIAVYAQHINLGFYYGATLPDVGVVLEGAGKKLRHLKLRSPNEASAPGIQKLLRAAFDERRCNAPSM